MSEFQPYCRIHYFRETSDGPLEFDIVEPGNFEETVEWIAQHSGDFLSRYSDRGVGFGFFAANWTGGILEVIVSNHGWGLGLVQSGEHRTHRILAEGGPDVTIHVTTPRTEFDHEGCYLHQQHIALWALKLWLDEFRLPLSLRDADRGE